MNTTPPAENGKQRMMTVMRVIWVVFITVAIILLLAEIVVGQPVQETGVGGIRGAVHDAASREPIASANVLVVGTTRGAASDLGGEFSIPNLPPGTWTIKVSALGYLSETLHEIVVTPGRDRNVEVLLKPTVVKGEEVTVTTERIVPVTPELPTSARNFRYEEVRRAPGSVEDVQRTVQALPGVLNANDQDNAIIVRGGAPNENLMVIDGIEVDNTNHLTIGQDVEGNGGPINALSTEFLQDVTFASGGFSARYGDRLSSILVLDLREGSRERIEGAADVNMAGAGGYLEGPIQGGGGSYLATLHKAYLTLLPPEDFGVASWPDYWSGQAKAVYDLSPRHKLTVNGLYLEDVADDNARPDDDTDFQWEGLVLNTERFLAGARLRSLWGNSFSDVVIARSAAYSRWVYTDFSQIGEDISGYMTTFSKRRTIQDQLHINWNGSARGKDQWAAGISLKPLTYEYEFFTEGDTIIYDDDFLGSDPDSDPDIFTYSDQHENVSERGLKYASYLQYTWRPRTEFSFTAGVRHDGFDYAGQDAVGPRLSASWGFQPEWSLNLAWGIYYQAHDPSVYMNEAGRADNRNLPYARADQYVVGLNFQPRSSSLITLEGFYKRYDNLLVREEDIVREQTGDLNYESDRWLAEGTKEAWGVEFFAQQKLATNWYGTLSYSYGMADAADPAYGTYASDYDYRQVATATLGYKTALIKQKGYYDFLHSPLGWWLWALPLNGDEVTVSSRYRYMTGRPYSSQIYYGEGVSSADGIYEGHWVDGGHNDLRYPGYSRWDVRIDSKHYFGKSALIVYVEAQNIDDHINIANYDFKEDGTLETDLQFRQFWVLGIKYEF